MQKINRVGESNVNRFGSKMRIVEYKNSHDVLIEFENGYQTRTEYKHFKNGVVKNPYDKSIFGVGYVGEGEYKPKSNGRITIQYQYWHNMMKRVYDGVTYKNCYVVDEWHNFQNFAKWFDDNYYQVEGQRMELDKDIIVKGNKTYSPEFCVLVPKNINSLFTKREADRGEYPIGVYFHKTKEKFVSKCADGKGKQKQIGYYDSIEEAFKAYKTFKEALIKQIADEYKNIIPIRLHYALMNYKVDIND